MKKTIIYILFILTLGLLPCWLQYGEVVMIGDFVTQQIPFIVETKKMLFSGTPFWSWNTYFGDNFWSAYSFYTISSPFVWINCLFPAEYIHYSLILTLYLKLIVLGLVSYKFFRKVSVSESNAVLGAVLMAFSSYVFINLCYYHFIEPIIVFVFLLISIEKCIRGERYAKTWLCLSSFAVFFINFYFVPCSFIPAVIYLFFRIRSTDSLQPTIKRIVSLSPYVILGALLSSFLLVPTLMHLAGNSRVENAGLFEGYNIQDRLVSLFTPKLKDGHIPLTTGTAWTSTAAYIPVFGFLLAFLHCLRNRNYISYTIISLLVLYLTPLNGIFSLFTDSSYTRWAYALVFFLIFASIKYLDAKQSLPRKAVLFYIGVCLLLLVWRYLPPLCRHFSQHEPFMSDDLPYTMLTIGVLVLSILLLLLYSRYPRKAMFFVASFSIVYLASTLLIRSDYYIRRFEKDEKKINLFGMYIKDNPLPYHTQQNCYRTDFITRIQPYFYANVGLLKNIPSVNTYHSVSNKKIKTLSTIAYSSTEPLRSGITKDCNQTTFDCLMSVKEIVKYKDPLSQTDFVIPCDTIEDNTSYTRYRCKYYIPFGFTYDSYILQSEIDSLNQLQPKPDIPLLMLASLAVQAEDVPTLSRYLSPGQISQSFSLDSIVDRRNAVVAQDMVWNTSGFSCTIDMTRDNVVFFSIPADPGLTATIDGRQTTIHEVNCQMSGIVVPQGYHHIQFSFIPKGFILGCSITIFSLIIFLFSIYYETRQNSELKCN